RGESGRGLRADAPHVPRPVRDVGAAADVNRIARRAMVRLDPRSVVARSVLRAAGPDGRDQFLAAEDDAGSGRRSGAAEDDDVHPAVHDVHLPLAPGRCVDLLRRHERLDDRPAVPDELPDWPAERAKRASARGTPAEAAGHERAVTAYDQRDHATDY